MQYYKFIDVDYNKQMHQQSKIEFFQSESSFGSESSLSDSRHYEFTNEIIAQTDNVFMTLKKELLPNQSHNQNDSIEYAIRRAQILKKNTIPEHIAYLNNLKASETAKEQLRACSQKLAYLLSDYDSLKTNKIAYKQFYNIYGKEFGLHQKDFSKKEALQLDSQDDDILRPQYVQINYSKEYAKLKGATPRLIIAGNSGTSDKQIFQLRQEVYRLKKQLQDNRKYYQIELTNQKITYQKRIKNYLTHSPTIEMQASVRQELEEHSQNFTQSLIQNKKMHQVISQRTKQIETLKEINRSQKEQIERLRKSDNKQLDDLDVLNKSYKTEFNNNNDIKLQKKVKNLTQQNQLLKSQLKAEREKRYKLQSDLNQQQRRQLQRNRFNLEKAKNELEEIYAKHDQARIQMLQLTQNNKINQKIIQSLRRQIFELKNKSQEKQHTIHLLSQSKNQKNSQNLKNVQRIQVKQYEGDGIEGFIYYQTLSKQFRTRFKRACLRQKDLLHKSNGIEIGVISSFERPNKINNMVHITNYSQTNLTKIKVKIMNANQNKVQTQTFQFQALAQNQQIKVPVSISIMHYPIGASILLLEYQSQKKEEVRISLPVHIFKAMLIEYRQDKINQANSIQKSITTEKKILKELNDLRQYFKLNNKDSNTLSVSLFHQHTHTLIYMDILQTREGFSIRFQHKEGNKFITEYFMKTFIFLLSKQSIK